jgi:hypothetical protein
VSLAAVPEIDLAALATRFDAPGVMALVLAGSLGRGEAGPFSDVDLVRLYRGETPPAGDGSHLIDGRLVTVRSWTVAAVEALFAQPDQLCTYLVGLRSAPALIDREGTWAALQTRARAFVWDEAIQAQANCWAAEQLVGWIEEVHKGLEGLRRHDTGRLLNARFGLSWGLSNVVKVQRGVLMASGDNGIWCELNRALGEGSRWVRLRAAAFGVDDGSGRPPTLPDQVRAGLALYIETVALMEEALPEPAHSMILGTVGRIRDELGDDNAWLRDP